MYFMKSRGPRTVSWGTPDRTASSLDRTSSTTTDYVCSTLSS